MVQTVWTEKAGARLRDLAEQFAMMTGGDGEVMIDVDYVRDYHDLNDLPEDLAKLLNECEQDYLMLHP